MLVLKMGPLRAYSVIFAEFVPIFHFLPFWSIHRLITVNTQTVLAKHMENIIIFLGLKLYGFTCRRVVVL